MRTHASNIGRQHPPRRRHIRVTSGSIISGRCVKIRPPLCVPLQLSSDGGGGGGGGGEANLETAI